jgi:hypothetical protein
VTIADRNFLVADDLTRLERSGANRHWLTRAKSTTRLRVIKKRGRNDALVEITLSDQNTTGTSGSTPRLDGACHHLPAKRLPALDAAHVAPRRETISDGWELELGYDEIKTHMLDRQEAIRSRTPAGVRQELWGIALAYNLVRLEMERAADEAGVEPTRISFVNALALIRNAWLAWSTLPLATGRIPEGLLYLRRYLKLLILPPRRPERAYPRAVKVKMSAYNRKAPTGKGRK